MALMNIDLSPLRAQLSQALSTAQIDLKWQKIQTWINDIVDALNTAVGDKVRVVLPNTTMTIAKRTERHYAENFYNKGTTIVEGDTPTNYGAGDDVPNYAILRVSEVLDNEGLIDNDGLIIIG